MSTTYKDIRDAITSRLNSGWGSSTAVNWPGTKLAPPKTAAWIQPRLMFSNADQAALGQNGFNRVFGDLHINVFVPVGKGTDECMVYVDTLRDLFPRGQKVLAGSRYITFGVPEAREPLEDQDYYQQPVICPWWLDELQ